MSARHAATAVVLAGLVACRSGGEDGIALRRVPAPRPGLEASGASGELTFFAAADLHFGTLVPLEPESALRSPDDGPSVPIERIHEKTIAQMRALPGKPFPGALGSTVGAPRGLIVAGDLTEGGFEFQFDRFERLYGALGIPLFESVGNHDLRRTDRVARRVAARHGGDLYAWEWDGIRFFSLSDQPGPEGLSWLEAELQALPPRAAVILVLHYPLLGPFSAHTALTAGGGRERLAALLEGRRAAIFHGHYHGSGAYRWQGVPVFTPGSPKHHWRDFLVARVRGDVIDVAAWSYEHERWAWWTRATFARSEALEQGSDPEVEGALVPFPLKP